MPVFLEESSSSKQQQHHLLIDPHSSRLVYPGQSGQSSSSGPAGFVRPERGYDFGPLLMGGGSGRKVGGSSKDRRMRAIKISVITIGTVIGLYLVYQWLAGQNVYYPRLTEIARPVESPPPKRLTVKLDVYMESFCPDTSDFISTQLVPTWDLLKDHLQLSIVPYGKASTQPAGAGQTDVKIQCQHGPRECLTNQLMCCGIQRLASVPAKYVPYIACVQEKKFDATASCSGLAGLEHEDLMKCAQSAEGRSLHADMGRLTDALSPKLHFIPWVVIDGTRSDEGTNDLKSAICGRLALLKKEGKQGPLPMACEK